MLRSGVRIPPGVPLSNIMPIQYNRIDPPTVSIIWFNGTMDEFLCLSKEEIDDIPFFLEYANEYELNDLRIQIKNNEEPTKDPNFSGYVVISNEGMHMISNKGMLSTWPKEFDLILDQLDQLTN